MAMDSSGNALGTLIVNKLATLNPRITGTVRSELLVYWIAISQVIVDYIQTNADVLPAGHSGPGLQNPVGQIGEITTGPSTGDATVTTVPEDITGMGSVA